MGESRGSVNGRLEEWREAYQSNGLMISRCKPEHGQFDLDFGERMEHGDRWKRTRICFTRMMMASGNM